MKLLVLQFAVIFTIFSSQCTSKNDANNKNIKTLDDKSHLANNIKENNLLAANKIDVSKDMKDIENAIEKTSKDFNLQNLKEKNLSDNEVEIRIWSEGAENSSVNCFILHKKTEAWKASLISVRVSDDGEYEKTKQGKIIINKQTLSSPKSGWENLSDYLIKKGIHFPLPYSLDTQKTPAIPDERVVDLEIKEGKNYGLVFFREFNV